MSSEFSERVQELRLLGWSQDGAQQYAENFPYSSNIISLLYERPFISLAILVGFLLIGFLIIYKFIFSQSSIKAQDNKKVIKPLDDIKVTIKHPESPKIIDFKDHNKNDIQIKENGILKRKYNYKKILSSLKETSIDTSVIVEHFLLFLFVFYELFFNLIKFISSTESSSEKSIHIKYVETSTINNSSSESIKLLRLEERSLDLSKKTNNQLRAMLIGIPNISNLRKSQLIDRILKIEYKNS